MALDRGVPADTFWDLSVRELLEMMESSKRREEARLKQDIILRFTEADAIASRIGRLFSGKGDTLQVYDAFPDLFDKEKDAAEEAIEERELERQKATMMAYAARWNKQRQEREGAANG